MCVLDPILHDHERDDAAANAPADEGIVEMAADVTHLSVREDRRTLTRCVTLSITRNGRSLPFPREECVKRFVQRDAHARFAAMLW